MFEEGNADWISELPSVNKQYRNTINQSTKMELFYAFEKTDEKIVLEQLQDKRGNQKLEFKL